MEARVADTGMIVFCLAMSGGGGVGAQRLALRYGAPVKPVEGGEFRFCRAAGECIALLAGVQMGCCFLLLSARPLLSIAGLFFLLALLVRLNRVKEETLREPLVLADAWLLPQLFRHPALYLPFLPARVLLGGLLAAVLCCAVLLRLENGISWQEHSRLLGFCLIAGFLPPAALCLLRLGRLAPLARMLLRLCPVSHDAAADAARCGHLAAALMHPVLAGRMEYGDLREATDYVRSPGLRPAASRLSPAFERMLREIAVLPLAERPHVVLVQAESFCDAREMFRDSLSPAQREALRDFLPHWDRLKGEERALPTPDDAFGAYTMRTECLMLTGLDRESLGPFAFNPYLLAARRRLWSAAWFFRDLGYETICLHPYGRKFFRRDKVMPNLGFHRFLAGDELGMLERFGSYASDAALGRRILEELEGAERPVFGFVITMEAHGPWLKGRLKEEEIAETLADVDRSLFSVETQLYLCHLRHMDELFGMLRNAGGGAGQGKRVEVWAYGDHAPGVKP
jgi:hypothetical protein